MRQCVGLIVIVSTTLLAAPVVVESDSLHVLSVHDLVHMEIEKEGGGERVVVRGFLWSEIQLGLYPTKDHARIADSVSAVNVYEGEERDRERLMQCADSYVEIIARIEYRESSVMWLIPSRVTVLELRDTGPPAAKVCWAADTLLEG